MPAQPDLDAPLDATTLGAAVAEVVAVVGTLSRRVARTVELAEPIEGMSAGLRSVLELVSTGPRPVPRIAEALALSRQFVQRLVNEAAQAGLVDLKSNPAHARSAIVALTGAGEARVAAVMSREHEVMSGIGGALTARDIDASLRVLRQVSAHFAPTLEDHAHVERAGADLARTVQV